jgi:tellurite resistance-related uncharacterized protein
MTRSNKKILYKTKDFIQYIDSTCTEQHKTKETFSTLIPTVESNVWHRIETTEGTISQDQPVTHNLI